MSERRLFSTKVTESDAFLDMPLSSQALYFHICLNCDDDGVCDSPRKIIRMVGAQADDLNILVAKRFLLQLSQNVFVVKHWLIHNSINKQRYKPSKHADLLAGLYIKENGAYTDDETTALKQWEPVVKQCLNNVETPFNLSQVKSSQEKLREVNIGQSSVIDLLTDEESELLDDHVTDFMELLDRLDAVDASTVKKPYAYCVKVAKQSGLWK